MSGQQIKLTCDSAADRAATTPSSRTVDEHEKWLYTTGRNLPIVFFGLISSLLLLIGLFRFATIEAILLFSVPFFLLNGTYLLLSYAVMLTGRPFDRKKHEQIVHSWQNQEEVLREVEIDVFLPVCGESIEVILETWRGVKQLRWPGQIIVTVLDDSPDETLRSYAEDFGFDYLRREGGDFRKAGNLRHGFAHTHAPVILLLDADFRPRPDMLEELVPYLLEDSHLALVQSPQFFDVNRQQNWVQAGAGFVQELFYRLIQPARDRFGAGVCVGSCAVYRRSALQELGGTPQISHSEDLWTGFELLNRGWSLKYVPVILAKGLCPDRQQAFFSQQYRWCLGSLSLVTSRQFWQSKLSLPQKICYVAGFFYYLATGMNTLLALMPPLVMATFYPDWVHWSHLAFSALALIYTPFLLCWWSVYPFGLHYLTTRELSGAAHLQAIVESAFGAPQDWIVTGAKQQGRIPGRFQWAFPLLILLAATGGAAIWSATVKAVMHQPRQLWHFFPLLLLSSVHVLICLRAMEGISFRSIRLDKRASIPHLHPLRLRTVITGVLACWLMIGAATFAFSPGFRHRQEAVHGSGRGLFPNMNTNPAADFGRYTVEEAFPGTDLRRIVRMRMHPRHPEVYFLADFTGLIHEVRNSAGNWQTRTIVDLTKSDLHFLYSFEIHPDYPEDPRFFLSYRTRGESSPLAMRLTEIAVSASSTVNAEAERLLIEQLAESEEHLGGDLAFDELGCLLVSYGDNQLSLQDQRSQRIDQSFFSGILRIDVNQRGGTFSHAPLKMPQNGLTANYLVPNDNPFVGQTGVLEEFWSIGLRNPFRMSFDVTRRELWIGEVGQDEIEQIEVARAGTNHQWSFREGSVRFEKSYLKGERPEPLLGISTNPLHEYQHEDLNTCVIGGSIYRGARFPELQGKYIYGDNRSGRIWAIDPDRPETRELITQLPFGKSSSTLVSISIDEAGEIYFTNFISVPAVYRLIPTHPAGFPGKLSETGLFTDVTHLVPAPGLLEYDVNVPLWSDGLEKIRWIRLPARQSIQQINDRWWFPEGTVFVKHFQQGSNGSFRRPGTPVETRVLVVRSDGSTGGATYLWNDSGTDAVLQLDRTEIDLFHDPDATYQLPGHRDCRFCHHRDNPVLGFTPEQINRTVQRDQREVHQLTWLSQQGVFERHWTSHLVKPLPALAPLEDQSAEIGFRARSYLHANCSYCHHTNGIEAVRMSLNLFEENEHSQLIGRRAKTHYHTIDGDNPQLLISPGNPADSAIYRRMLTSDRRYSMPYLGRSLPDLAALKLFEQWIEELEEDFLSLENSVSTESAINGDQ